jgi:predicted RND superfamily exporter protein
MIKLEEKIVSRNEAERQALYQEIDLQINNLKQDFRNGLETFQYQVSNQLQNGLEEANLRFHSSIPNVQKIEMQIDNRNIEQQRYINTLFTGSKQAIKKLEHQINSMRYFVIFLSIVFVTVSLLLLY